MHTTTPDLSHIPQGLLGALIVFVVAMVLVNLVKAFFRSLKRS